MHPYFVWAQCVIGADFDVADVAAGFRPRASPHGPGERVSPLGGVRKGQEQVGVSHFSVDGPAVHLPGL